ncbi:hypothetical protein VVD49_14875 [Uliginosibacterium sp. H3]|uniref:MSHA biogenesis protein MshK n=1 Tax=Uliginosibacterium silvisoli TaxID=3114758 RepID=A0ABU6K5Z7_9RHOO|nr:hypothetical protein [Uliginosibacterium sp. H3]
MTLRNSSLLVITVLFSGATQAAEADWQTGLGRLFLTPQKRALLDELRRNNARIDPAQQLDSVRLDGIVRRSSGKQTIWINGQSYTDHAPVTRVDDSSARVISGSKTGVELKVGESRQLGPTNTTGDK